jgi:uncharacterized protein (DUF433 family)
MSDKELLARVRVNPEICSGRPYIRGSRIRIAIILDALVEGLTPADILDHYPVLEFDDIRAAVAYATQLAQSNGGIVFLNQNPPSLFQLR